MRFLRVLPVACSLAGARAESAEDLLARAAVLAKEDRDAEALTLYVRADALRPGDADILRLLAIQCLEQIDGRSASRDRDAARRAVEYAERAKAANPDNAQARLALAVCAGRAAQLEAPSRRMGASRRIKEEAEAAVRLDPSLDDAWHVLGRWNYEIANLNPAVRFLAERLFGRFPDASNERAASCFEKAIALRPRRVVHHGELGRTYAALGRKEDARAELTKCLDLPALDQDDEECQARARQALAALD